MGKPGELMRRLTCTRENSSGLCPRQPLSVPGAQGCYAQRPQGQARALWPLQAKQCPEVHGSQRHGWEGAGGRQAGWAASPLLVGMPSGQPTRAPGKVWPDLSHGTQATWASCPGRPGGAQVCSRGGTKTRAPGHAEIPPWERRRPGIIRSSGTASVRVASAGCLWWHLWLQLQWPGRAVRRAPSCPRCLPLQQFPWGCSHSGVALTHQGGRR